MSSCNHLCLSEQFWVGYIILLSVVCSVDMCIKMNHILFLSHCLSTLVSQALLGLSMHIFNSLLLPKADQI